CLNIFPRRNTPTPSVTANCYSAPYHTFAMSRTGRYAATNAVNDLEDGEAWPEEGLAHRELDMVQSRLNDLMLRNAPARVARGRQRRDPRAQAETTAVFAPMAGTFVPGPDQALRLVGFKPRSGAA